MNSNFETQTIAKIQVILKLLEDTLNVEGGFEVKVKKLDGETKGEKVRTTYDREKYLVSGIESSIAGLHDLVYGLEQRKNMREQMMIISNNKSTKLQSR